MLVQIVTENGQKKIIPLTADAGAGLPVGFIAPAYKKGNYSGWLYLDGRDTTGTSEELSTHYPILYAFLGSNKLPDYREFALVGAEENTTDVYNASTNPNGTIHDHDVYTEGQAKDDQLQDHTQRVESVDGYKYRPLELSAAGTGSYTISPTDLGTNNTVAKTITAGRHGTVTRGKRKAVYFYIKATSGLSENAQDNVINTLNEQRSYSTEEHWTGRKWIDGKPIYEKTFVINHTANQQYSLETLAQDIDFIAKVEYTTNKITIGNHTYQIINNGTWDNIGGNTDYQIGFLIDKDETNQTLSFSLKFGNSIKPYTFDTWVTLEYTKTTD